MIVLALDTATEVLSVAISDVERGSGWSHSCVSDSGLHHTGTLMQTVDALVRRAEISFRDIDLFACMRGPGSFTGLRIGMSTAKGLAESKAALCDCGEPPLVSLPTLEVMALSVPSSGPVLSVIDGRKNRFYAVLARGGAVPAGPVDLAAGEVIPALLQEARLRAGEVEPDATGPIVVTGPHARKFCDEFATAVSEGRSEKVDLLVDPEFRKGWATSLARQAPEHLRTHGFDPRDQGPDYVRTSDAEIGITRR